MNRDVEVTKSLLYVLIALDAISYQAAMDILRKGGYGGPTTMLCFLLKFADNNKKRVV